jgi:hypothetical protein
MLLFFICILFFSSPLLALMDALIILLIQKKYQCKKRLKKISLKELMTKVKLFLII